MNNGHMPRLEAKVRLYRDAQQGRAELLGFADLVIADCFVIKGIRIVAAKNDSGVREEPFVSFPSKKSARQERYFDIAHPITTEARREATEVILKTYHDAAAREDQ